MLLSRPQNAGQNDDNDILQMIWKCGQFQIFGNDSNKTKFDSGGN
jgi:hypothetical protein